MTLLGDQEVVRLRAVETPDDYGNTVIDWATPDQLTIADCSVQPQPAAEYTDTREQVLNRWELWAPIDTDITSTDRVEFAGDTYIVDGSVQLWPSPLPHLTCLLRLLSED